MVTRTSGFIWKRVCLPLWKGDAGLTQE